MTLAATFRAALAAGLLALAAAPVAAQDQRPAASLGDVRADLRALTAELQSLRAELNASGAAGFQAAGGDSAIDRMNAIESELSRLTGETERLKNRVERVVRDGTNRVGDIEFRLCEIEEGCDLGALTTPMLGDQDGGGAGLAPAVVRGSAAEPAPAPTDALTARERADMGRASDAMQAGDFPRAAQLYGDFAATHAGSPAAAEALFLKGAALDAAADPKAATAAWLSAFAADPTGPRAPDALLGLSRVSATGRPASEGCVYLLELTTRFSGTPQADEAAKRMASAGCETGADADPELGADLGADPLAGADPEAAADLADGG
ncbi:tol-pal system protein [Paracoccus luteus]|uniref:tol-pal system protein n=1 Tax=Paracoccus luteus TaxID=2508543 RepID=UPI00106FD4CD|nr:tol-pal system protein [Paracoccus luteus]